MTMSTAIRPPPRPVPDPKPMIIPGRTMGEQVLVKIFVLISFAALVAAVPIVWGWGLGWTDLALAASFYVVACLGVTAGYHLPPRRPRARARHGVLRGQFDVSARVIWIFEKLGWICDVRWTNPARLARITARPHRAGGGDVPVRETTQELTS